MTVRELAAKLQTLDINRLVERAVKMNEKKLVEMNRDQMRQGLTSKGQTIAPSLRSYVYARNKKQRGGVAPMGVPDLRNTGSFQEAMLLGVSDNEYEFYSTDDKSRDLIAKYKDIFGLTEENKRRAKALNTETLMKLVRREIIQR